MIIRKEFACIAEAVTYYYKRGYDTVDSTDRSRIMRRNNDEVIINHEDFLLVTAEELIH